MTALEIAMEALRTLREAGITVFAGAGTGARGERFAKTFRCPTCKTLFADPGLCTERDCPSVIARRALDEMRRAP